MKAKLTIATRDSALALWQAHWVRDQVMALHPSVTVELLKLKTQGDKILDTPLAKIGGKGLFVKELEVALLEGQADLAVHSLKDVPAELPEGLTLSVITKRESPDDAFVSNRYPNFASLPPGAKVGTSSLRRSAQLKRARPDLVFESLRGNVNTRLRKLDEGLYDCIILAAAGLIRLGMEERIAERLDHGLCLPSLCQGIVGIETRVGDQETGFYLAGLQDGPTDLVARAERALLQRLNGGCQVPFAGQAQLEGNQMQMEALVASPEGDRLIRLQDQGPASEPEALGRRLAERLLASGAREILGALGIVTH
ncbi:MAG: hydroxymethylbilane synthase [Candidatus Lambdaproteobacteria bacterium RIFOXYD1_FULL_56_27]|uniref:Porphobilinogen deaminase n=1 Tax=Candidatus Lambdaproteobacteria bacterium RIFOXYD2_FULL_56_26 TaxID=1817773 RepID=A0A1F6H1L5_9PROT|nr:MAG: hydroxymethylbilane synthase [Candidatus Lambdaproteobacteria bacterium RIFOXYD2_FULL_56_26]OGH05688.1 MAG: hydroxymethylbilane synthase [Candidatus Lambdaproteobacteria bacterium RIFOXYC1_FULL_56_13]OGH08445.1 MAG: hydroxymethylbilane synthase [Candidatus Lambdaproteobacteria bacterium RIFOXYD1_FULL_56_27]